MNIEEKRNALYDFCLSKTGATCSECVLGGEKYRCGRGVHFRSRTGGKLDMTDEEIDLCFALVFPEAKDTEQTDTPHIKDSGERREFASGAVRDIQKGKGRMDLLPWAAILEVSKHCENGAEKYGEHNVDKGLPTHSFCDSAARHLAKYLEGWEDEPHLLAAAWNLLWAIQMEVTNPEMVDTPWVKYKHKYETSEKSSEGTTYAVMPKGQENNA